MKKHIFILLFPLILFASCGKDEPEKDLMPDGVGNILIFKNNNPTIRPQAPSHQEITCEYSDGNLKFNLRYPEGMCELTVTEQNGSESSYSFDSASEAIIYVGKLSAAHLLITTENGHSYEDEMR